MTVVGTQIIAQSQCGQFPARQDLAPHVGTHLALESRRRDSYRTYHEWCPHPDVARLANETTLRPQLPLGLDEPNEGARALETYPPGRPR